MDMGMAIINASIGLNAIDPASIPAGYPETPSRFSIAESIKNRDKSSYTYLARTTRS